MIIGTSDFSKIKTPTKPRVGKPGEPVAELTLSGWMMMSPGHELEYRNFCLLDHQAVKTMRDCAH